MRSSPRSGISAALLVIAISFAIVQPALALQYPLTSTSIREAYFLGKENGDSLTRFLLPYSHAFPMPKTGPHVAVISLATPFIQILEHSAGTANYSAPAAVEEFSGKSFPLLVRVQIDLTATFLAPTNSKVQTTTQPIPDFYNDFDIQLIQSKKIPAKSKSVSLIYSDASANIYGLGGAIVELAYDPEKIDPGSDATVIVNTPDGQHIETTFNLAALR